MHEAGALSLPKIDSEQTPVRQWWIIVLVVR